MDYEPVKYTKSTVVLEFTTCAAQLHALHVHWHITHARNAQAHVHDVTPHE